MNLKQSEPYFHGYILVSCRAEDCNYQSQLQGLQTIPSSYKPSILNCNAVLAEQKEHQATRTSPFASLRRDDSRLFFPAIHRERPQSCEASRYKVGEEGLLTSSVFRSKLDRVLSYIHLKSAFNVRFRFRFFTLTN